MINVIESELSPFYQQISQFGYTLQDIKLQDKCYAQLAHHIHILLKHHLESSEETAPLHVRTNSQPLKEEPREPIPAATTSSRPINAHKQVQPFITMNIYDLKELKRGDMT